MLEFWNVGEFLCLAISQELWIENLLPSDRGRPTFLILGVQVDDESGVIGFSIFCSLPL